MQFTWSTYGLLFVVHAVGIILIVFERRLPRSFTFGQNAEFKWFQNRFVVGYLPCLFAESLQAPFLYYLYHSYGFLESQIAVLYICGYITSVIGSIAVILWVSQRVERRVQCLLFVGLNSLSCCLKFSGNYSVLMISRVMDGIASSLLGSSFQDWYVHEHIHVHDFPKEWVGLTFKKVALIGPYIAIWAGFIAEASETALVSVVAFPFLCAVPFLCGAGFWIFKSWTPNRLNADFRITPKSMISRALKCIGNQPTVLLLAVIQSLFEAVLCMFAFLWTPLFIRVKTLTGVRAPYGIMYACFMASVMAGTALHRLISRRLQAVFILPVASALCLSALTLCTLLTRPGSHSELQYALLMICLCSYQFGVGLYFPTVQRLHKELLPSLERGTIVGIFRIPLTILSCSGLWLLHDRDSQRGNWLLMLICTVLLLLCLVSSIALQALYRRLKSRVTEQVLMVESDDEM